MTRYVFLTKLIKTAAIVEFENRRDSPMSINEYCHSHRHNTSPSEQLRKARLRVSTCIGGHASLDGLWWHLTSHTRAGRIESGP